MFSMSSALGPGGGGGGCGGLGVDVGEGDAVGDEVGFDAGVVVCVAVGWGVAPPPLCAPATSIQMSTPAIVRMTAPAAISVGSIQRRDFSPVMTFIVPLFETEGNDI